MDDKDDRLLRSIVIWTWLSAMWAVTEGWWFGLPRDRKMEPDASFYVDLDLNPSPYLLEGSLHPPSPLVNCSLPVSAKATEKLQEVLSRCRQLLNFTKNLDQPRASLMRPKLVGMCTF